MAAILRLSDHDKKALYFVSVRLDVPNRKAQNARSKDFMFTTLAGRQISYKTTTSAPTITLSFDGVSQNFLSFTDTTVARFSTETQTEHARQKMQLLVRALQKPSQKDKIQ
jgi:hypothetical protein